MLRQKNLPEHFLFCGLFRVRIGRGEDSDLQACDIVFRMSLGKLIDDVPCHHTAVQYKSPGFPLLIEAANAVADGGVGAVVIAAEVAATWNLVCGSMGFRQQLVRTAVSEQIGAKPLPICRVEAYRGVEVEGLVGEQIDLLTEFNSFRSIHNSRIERL